MRLTPLSDDVARLVLPPRSFINAYLLGDVLVDAGMGMHARAIVKALAGRSVATHVITHAHADHAGGSKTVTEALGVPASCGAGDAAAIRAGKPVAASPLAPSLRHRGHPVHAAAVGSHGV